MYNYSSVEDTVAPGQQGHAVSYTETAFIKGLNYQQTERHVKHGRVFLVPCKNDVSVQCTRYRREIKFVTKHGN